MSKTAWALLSGAAGLLIGGIVGGGLGTVAGSTGGALAGANMGACQAGATAVASGITDEATADRIVTATLAKLAQGIPMLRDPKITSLATCRSSGVLAAVK